MGKMVMLRKLDDMGRLVIPSEIRRAMDIKIGDNVQMSIEGERLILEKFSAGCIFCAGTEDLVCYQGKHVCSRCLKTLKETVIAF